MLTHKYSGDIDEKSVKDILMDSGFKSLLTMQPADVKNTVDQIFSNLTNQQRKFIGLLTLAVLAVFRKTFRP